VQGGQQDLETVFDEATEFEDGDLELPAGVDGQILALRV
jgi:hypothetical protein